MIFPGTTQWPGQSWKESHIPPWPRYLPQRASSRASVVLLYLPPSEPPSRLCFLFQAKSPSNHRAETCLRASENLTVTSRHHFTCTSDAAWGSPVSAAAPAGCLLCLPLTGSLSSEGLSLPVAVASTRKRPRCADPSPRATQTGDPMSMLSLESWEEVVGVQAGEWVGVRCVEGATSYRGSCYALEQWFSSLAAPYSHQGS